MSVKLFKLPEIKLAWVWVGAYSARPRQGESQTDFLTVISLASL